MLQQNSDYVDAMAAQDCTLHEQCVMPTPLVYTGRILRLLCEASSLFFT